MASKKKKDEEPPKGLNLENLSTREGLVLYKALVVMPDGPDKDVADDLRERLIDLLNMREQVDAARAAREKELKERRARLKEAARRRGPATAKKGTDTRNTGKGRKIPDKDLSPVEVIKRGELK